MRAQAMVFCTMVRLHHCVMVFVDMLLSTNIVSILAILSECQLSELQLVITMIFLRVYCIDISKCIYITILTAHG